MEFLEAIADPKHERHTELTEWRPADFDPNAIDFTHIEQDLATLAKRWSRTKSAPRRNAT